jgi:hypothetical protein
MPRTCSTATGTTTITHMECTREFRRTRMTTWSHQRRRTGRPTRPCRRPTGRHLEPVKSTLDRRFIAARSGRVAGLIG